MPRTLSDYPVCDPSETLDSVLQRCPSKNLKTPAAGKPVTIRPLKRVKTDEGGVPRPEASPPVLDLNEQPRGLLSPRKLDMDAGVALANPTLLVGDEEDVDGERDEEAGVRMTQSVSQPVDTEEGELPPSSTPVDALDRSESAAPPALERTVSMYVA